MTADDAFKNLLRGDGLAIPVVKSLRGAKGAAPDRPGQKAEMPAGQGGADYLPGTAGDEAGESFSSHPTETDLEPTEESGGLAAAAEEGAHILGRDVATDVPGASPAPPAPGGQGESRGGGVDLAKARRVRRFGCPPVDGIAFFEDQARDLSARIGIAAPDRPSLMVVSAERGEGRTELAIRLALALAKKVGAKILLADFDLKRPGVAARLGISAKYFTLADALRGACPLEDALTYGVEDNLYVLPSRASERAGDDIVDPRQLGALAAAIHSLFDFAVFDCGPAAQSDALSLCRHVGAVLLSGLAGKTSARRANEAAERLDRAGVAVAGMVVSGV